MIIARIAVGIWVVTSIGTLGCGRPDHPPLYPVTGKVVFADGQPLTVGGTVRFQSLATRNAAITLDASGVINGDGTFELSTRDFGRGVAAGEYRGLVQAEHDMEKNAVWPPPSIDPRFSRYQTSELVFTVVEGDNDFTIVVDRPSGPSATPPGRGQ